jgi:hypothetical protein
MTTAPTAAVTVSTTAAANSPLTSAKARPMVPNCLAADVMACGM